MDENGNEGVLNFRHQPRRPRTMAEVLGVNEDDTPQELDLKELQDRIPGVLARRKTDPTYNETIKVNLAQQWRLTEKGPYWLADQLNKALRKNELEVNGLVALAEAYEAARVNKTE